MPEQFKIDPNHQKPRKLLRTIGPIFMVLGGLGLLIGLIDFIMAFGGSGSPKLFWCAFVGIPLLAIGGMLTQAGYAGRIMRFMAQQTAPVAKDTFNYMADGTQEGVRKVSRAFGEGLGGGLAAGAAAGTPAKGQVPIPCPKCHNLTDPDARFCDQCGAPVEKNHTCPDCGQLNDSDARFCDNCGRALTTE